MVAQGKAPGSDPGADEHRPIPNYYDPADYNPVVEPAGVTFQGVYYPFPWTLPAEPSDG